MRVAIVHDWLLGMRGGERCLEVILEIFPDADLYTLFYDRENVTEIIRQRPVVRSVLDSLPGVHSYYRHLLPLYPIAVRDLERRLAEKRYDLVLSISHCVAKNVAVPHGTKHLCYCLTPVRYLWDQYDVYFGAKRLEPIIRMLAAPLRRWDVRTAQRVDRFMGISEFIRQRIRRCWSVDADVVYPPVRTDWIRPRAASDRGDGFLCVNALVPYKNTAVIVEAFNQLGLPLTVVGRGPELAALRERAAGNITFVESVTDEQLAKLYQGTKALVFAAEEDFGMVPVEIQAAGRPVICYGRGGVLETVSASGERPTGLYFETLSPASVSAAVQNFLVRQDQFTVDNCLTQARKFSLSCFREAFSQVLESSGFSGEPRKKTAAF